MAPEVHEPGQGSSLAPPSLPAAALHAARFERALLPTFQAIVKSRSPASAKRGAKSEVDSRVFGSTEILARGYRLENQTGTNGLRRHECVEEESEPHHSRIAAKEGASERSERPGSGDPRSAGSGVYECVNEEFEPHDIRLVGREGSSGRSERVRGGDPRSAGTGVYEWVHEDSEHRRLRLKTRRNRCRA